MLSNRTTVNHLFTISKKTKMMRIKPRNLMICHQIRDSIARETMWCCERSQALKADTCGFYAQRWDILNFMATSKNKALSYGY